MSALTLSNPSKLTCTTIPNSFIDTYLPAADPLFSVVLIYFCRMAQAREQEISTRFVADKFEVTEAKVLRVFEYWEKAGVIKIEKKDDELAIELNLNAHTPAASAPPPTPTVGAGARVPAAGATPVILDSRPAYSQAELELYQSECAEIQRLFAAGEKALAKLLKYDDLSVLFGLHDWLRLPVDVIEILLGYCAENSHRNLNYIEKVGVTWAENNIRTPDDARRFIQTYNTDFREIMKSLGLRQDPAPKQIEYMKKWLALLPLPVVLEACDRTILQLSKADFRYTNRIISKWDEAGIKTLDGVNVYEAEHSADEAAKAKDAPKKSSGSKTNRFANFEQYDWDEEKLKKLDTLYLE